MEKLYEEWISPEEALLAHKEKEENSALIGDYKDEITTINEAFFKSKKNVRVLDFGMGWGTWARTAKDLGWEVYGAELLKSRVEYADRNGIEAVNPEKSNFLRFDFINTEQVFEHLPEPLTTLKTMKEWLRKDGIIKISVPSAKNMEERLKKMDWCAPKFSRNSLNPVAPLEHINLYKRKTILKMAHLAGLKEIKLPIMAQYKNTDWNNNFKINLKKVIKPIRLNHTNHLNYVFLKKAKGTKIL